MVMNQKRRPLKTQSNIINNENRSIKLIDGAFSFVCMLLFKRVIINENQRY